MKKLLFAGLLLYTSLSFAQDPTSTYFNLTRNGFNEKNAFETTAFVEQRWRLHGNKGFNETIYYVESLLKKAGFVQEQTNESEALLTYRIEKRPMKQNAWDPINAIVSIEGEQEPLLEFKTNRNMITINSTSTPAEGITAEVVYLNPTDIGSIEDKDIKGKIVFSEIGTGRLFNVAINSGALGVLGYAMPGYTQPEKYQTSIQFSGINNPAGKSWAINLSYKAKERLKIALAKGPVKLNVKVEVNTYPSEELTIIANVKGSTNPDERFVYSAHVQEPGANDNASGVGTLAEMARLTADLVKSGKLTPQRTLTFLWGDEIISTQRYIKENSERAKGIMWGMSLDMVGENTEKTGGSFLIEKMPDPSAIWTRGDDKHSEWGSGDVKESDLFPHYYNDLVMKICNDQGKHANWKVNYNPFEGGSDHTPFINSKIPGLLMWHFTDVFYHTDNDRLDKVSATTMKNVGISALTTAYTLVTANESTALFIINEVKTAALKRLKAEYNLSKQAISEGKSAIQDEKHILSTWGKFYTDALTTIPSVPVKTETTRVGSAIKFAVLEVEKQANQYLEDLR